MPCKRADATPELWVTTANRPEDGAGLSHGQDLVAHLLENGRPEGGHDVQGPPFAR